MIYFDIWKEKVDKSLSGDLDQWGMVSGYPGVIASAIKQGGRLSSWDKISMPSSAVENDLSNYIFIATVYPNHEYCHIFLNWANEAADRALADERFNIDPESNKPVKFIPNGPCRGWKIEGVYPGNHGSTLVAACLSQALRDGSELSSSSLLQAVDEIVETSLYGSSSDWNYIPQSWYLRCVRLCLIAGHVEKAQLLLKSVRRKFKQTYVHQQWLEMLCGAIYLADSGPLTKDAIDKFQAFFDEVRNPELRGMPSENKDGTNLFGNINILRLELAIIKQLYIRRQSLDRHWGEVLKSISE